MVSPKSAVLPSNFQGSHNHAHFNRSYDANSSNVDQNTLAMRKSPNKPNLDPRGTFEYGSQLAANLQANTATTSGTNSTNNSGNHLNNIKAENNLAQLNGNNSNKIDRPTRMDIFLKNHMKSLQIHQLVLEVYGL